MLTEALLIYLKIELSRKDVDGQFLIGTLSLCTGLINAVGCRENHTHAAMSFDFGFAENTHLNAGFLKHLFEVVHFDFISVALDYDCARSRRTVKTDSRNGKAEKCAGMEGKLAHVLRNHRHHAGVMGPG